LESDEGTIEEDVSDMQKTGSVVTERAFKKVEKKRALAAQQ
jgi:hypothetical protein